MSGITTPLGTKRKYYFFSNPDLILDNDKFVIILSLLSTYRVERSAISKVC